MDHSNNKQNALITFLFTAAIVTNPKMKIKKKKAWYSQAFQNLQKVQFS